MKQVDDFGFSFASETELKAYENQLSEQLKQQEKIVVKKETELTDKLHQLRDMVMPLLINLKRDPEKEYILWPSRVEKIDAFIEKINKFVDDK